MPTRPLPDGRIPVLLSAHEEKLIARDAAAILGYLDREPGAADVGGVAATLLRTRRVRRHRAVLRVADRDELAAGLRALAGGDEHPLVTRCSAAAAPRVAFVCPGQGNQWPSMGADAYRLLPAYRAAAEECAQAFAAAGYPSPLPYLLAGGEQDWAQIQVQGAQFTHSVSLAQVWRCCGIRPAVTVGHSLGEAAAAYLAGSLSLADTVAVVAARASVVEQLAGRYAMAVLGVGVDETNRLIGATAGWLEVSAVNAESSTVVSGDRDAVTSIVRLAPQRGIFAREIGVDYPGHTSALEPLRDEFEELLPASALRNTQVQFVSSARGSVVGAGTEFSDYWWQNLRNTVRFDRAVTAAARLGARAFVELSAHPALLPALGDLVDDTVIVGSGRRDEPITDQLSANIAAVALADPGYRWADVSAVTDQPPLPGFPNAPMRAIHLWVRPEPLPRAPGSSLTVAFEDWVPCPAGPPAAVGPPRPVAVIGPDAGDDPLTPGLAAVIAAHPGCRLVDPDVAEVAVLVARPLLHPDPVRAAGQLAAAAPHDYTRVIGPRCRWVWLVTTGGERVGPDESVDAPAQAALAAMHRSVGFEFPDHTFAHLDLPGRDIDTATARACVAALLGQNTEVAVRAGHRYQRLLTESAGAGRELGCRPDARVPDNLDNQENLDNLDNVVITGGSGEIGLRYARYCVEHGAHRVILLSRTGIDQATRRQLLDGVVGFTGELHAPVCDITDPGAVAAAAADYAGDGVSLLVHAAGTAAFGSHTALTGAELADMFGAKVVGLTRMAEAWPLRSRARIVLCSSVSGIWGGHGHAGYAAANRLLDVAADRLRGRGLDCVSVRWGLWPGTGIADPAQITRIERSGLVAMDPGEAIAAGLRHYRGDPLILAADLERLQVFFENHCIPTSFTLDRTATPPAPDDEAHHDGRSVEELVRAELAATLSLAEQVDLAATLVELGVDSLLALDLRNRLQRRTGRSVPLARLLGGITGTELIDALRPNPDTQQHEKVAIDASVRVPGRHSGEIPGVAHAHGYLGPAVG